MIMSTRQKASKTDLRDTDLHTRKPVDPMAAGMSKASDRVPQAARLPDDGRSPNDPQSQTQMLGEETTMSDPGDPAAVVR
jgi:hypothetical protein